jgi:hypothetical protein
MVQNLVLLSSVPEYLNVEFTYCVYY